MKTQSVSCIHHGRGGQTIDTLAVEAPLELIVDGHPVSVVMRTPGNDRDLMLGFLLTEGIIQSVDDIERIADDYGDNRIVAFLKDGVKLDLERLTRHTFSSSSCGLCGKATLDAVLQDHPPIDGPRLELAEATLLQTLKTFELQQDSFQSTGGLHAAALFDLSGTLLTSHEDVGRHNAVDKVIGFSAQNAIPMSECLLLVSGRVSFEIMQKAIAARIPCLCAVSAPSSLAVEFSKDSNQTLIGFFRPPTWNEYHQGRVQITATR